MWGHTGDKPYQCSHCDIAYSIKYKFKIHMKIHTGDKSYQCNQCDKAFFVNSNLVRHMRPNTKEKPYQWKIFLKYMWEHTLERNHNNAINVWDKPYQCSHCGKSFSEKD